MWWVIVVVSLATALGLAVAVLADRPRRENAAKSLIFLPMAISFIGAGIIWRFVYQARDPSQRQTGVLNAIWVWIGQSAVVDGSRAIALVVLVAHRAVPRVYFIRPGVETKSTTTAGFAAGFLLLDRLPRSTGSSAAASAATSRSTASAHRSPCCSSRSRRSTTCG